MPIAGMSRSPFLFWDGRKDSLWAQALGPLESAVEHGGTRAQYAQVIAEALPGRLRGSLRPIDLSRRGSRHDASADARSTRRVFVNIGKAIAAYERRIEFGPVALRPLCRRGHDTGSTPTAF